VRRTRLLSLLVIVPAFAFGLAACGGDDSGSEEEDQIAEAIETSVLTTDPADCTRLQTQNFTEQVNFSTGEEAIADCEEDVADTSNDPDEVEVGGIEVDGDAATADVTFTGGGFDGSTLTVALVKEEDQWKLDEITDIPTLDLESFKESFTSQLEAEGNIPPQIADCIAGEINSASEEEVKGVILGGSEDDLVGLLGSCIPGA
jgi:hypothetical protein